MLIKNVTFGTNVSSVISLKQKMLLEKVTTRMSATGAKNVDPSNFHCQKGK